MASGAGYDHLASRKTAFVDGDIVGVAGLHGLERAHELPDRSATPIELRDAPQAQVEGQSQPEAE